uniref:Ankyrin and armadillo repeat-containing protein-like n=1 Tax=Saccoglossus kowalevskii TaxID=10224 RepID=A0ABM0MN82_SACKO|nr:PREDICTED: ankyrin and armadillo repeat-containing protein-like [Saccoglossus kowalevskii]
MSGQDRLENVNPTIHSRLNSRSVTEDEENDDVVDAIDSREVLISFLVVGGRSWGTSSEVEKDEYTKEKSIMNDLDEKGWGHIHHAASRGFIKSITRFVMASEDQLEFPTADDRHMTPLLLGVESGNLETVEYEEAEAGGMMLANLTTRTEDKVSPYWEDIYNNEGVTALVKVTKGQISDKAKIYAFQALLNIIEPKDVKDKAVQAGAIPAILKQFKSSDKKLVLVAAKLLCQIAKVSDYVDLIVNHSAIPALVKLSQTMNDTEILVQVVTTLGLIAKGNPEHRAKIGGTSGCFSALSALYDECKSKSLLIALTTAIAQIVKDNRENQSAFINEGGASHVIMLASQKIRELQLCAIEAIHMLALDNQHTQKAILEEGGIMPLMQLLKRSRAPNVQVCTAQALWALAGENMEERRTMGSAIGVNLLIEFLSALPEHDVLHYIGAEGLGVLAQGPLNKQDLISQSNGVQPLVRLLRSTKEHIVLSAIRALRYLCVGIGFVPHEVNQNTLASSRGIRYLVPLMIYSKNELIQVESALTLGCAALGNVDVMSQINDNSEFNYVHILRLLYSHDDLVRLLAGSALSAFGYNSLQQQKEIAESGGVRYHCFVPFLESEDEFFRCNSAFQVVVLARIIPDEDQASSSAIGIKLLVDLLEESNSQEIHGLAADCIARLAHTRAGVPAAIVSVNAVYLLCKLMLSESEQVRGSAAIALGYLSYNHKAERQLLNRCRKEPVLMKVLKYHTRKSKLSPQFTEDWKHFMKIGLPPIDDKPSLVCKKPDYLQMKPQNEQHRYTILSFGESVTSHQQSSPTNQLSITYNEELIPDAPITVDAPVMNDLTNPSPKLSSGSQHTPHTASSVHSNRSIQSEVA